MKPLDILALGAGIQSSTILLMSIKGELPKLDHCLFADVGWEPKEVYEQIEFLKPLAEAAGIPLHVVSNGSLKEIAIRGFTEGKEGLGQRYATIPLHLRHPDGTTGILKRQCTQEFKIKPQHRFIKEEILGLRRRQHFPKEVVVNHWYGISSDEAIRIRISADRWKANVYPLLNLPTEYLPHLYSRQHCVKWLGENYPETPMPRSACIGCPYHSNASWRDLRDRRPEEWAEAVAIDKQIRHGKGMRATAYLHKSAVPLDEANIDDDTSQGMFDGMRQECMGYCGN